MMAADDVRLARWLSLKEYICNLESFVAIAIWMPGSHGHEALFPDMAGVAVTGVELWDNYLHSHHYLT